MVNIPEAITTAIEFETRVRDVSSGAMRQSKDPVGQRVFRVLEGEEQNHLAYLESRLDEWKKTGEITVEELATSVPPKEKIAEAAASLEERVAEKDQGIELELLRQALAVETETSEFYQRMARELSDEGQRMFARFVEIEQGHRAIVQAEIDSLDNTGFWFDMQEFDLEAY
jgi:rubrerythrin